MSGSSLCIGVCLFGVYSGSSGLLFLAKNLGSQRDLVLKTSTVICQLSFLHGYPSGEEPYRVRLVGGI